MISSLYAGVLGLLFFVISIETIRTRRREKVSLGVGSDNQIIHLVSAHSNFVSYTPFFLFLCFLLETQNMFPIVLHGLFLIFCTGRLLHFLSMRNKERTFKKRRMGMMMTLMPTVAASLMNIKLALTTLIF